MADDKNKQVEQMIEVILRMVPKEKEAQRVYRSTAAKATSEAARRLFNYLADQEKEHENKLLAILRLLREGGDERRGAVETSTR